jgi:hypothetical protein
MLLLPPIDVVHARGPWWNANVLTAVIWRFKIIKVQISPVLRAIANNVICLSLSLFICMES